MESAARFVQLKEELDIYRKVMSQAIEVIRDKDVSDYPIFIAHQQQVDMGIPIVEKNASSRWAIAASSLEEFVTKGIIFNDKTEEFKKNYKDSDAHICVFVLSELGAKFVFLPKKK